MKILIIERNTDPTNPEAETYKPAAEIYKHLLETRGHIVNITHNLLGHDLENYDICIAHPYFEDVTKLRDEIKKRANFRIIFHTVDQKDYEDLIFNESNQVCSFFAISQKGKAKIIGLIENGWSKSS